MCSVEYKKSDKLAKSFLDVAARESELSYHCLFFFFKVLLSVIINEFFSSRSYLFSWLEVERGGWWGAEMNWALALAPGLVHILA